jgi:hypothetical protein
VRVKPRRNQLLLVLMVLIHGHQHVARTTNSNNHSSRGLFKPLSFNMSPHLHHLESTVPKTLMPMNRNATTIPLYAACETANNNNFIPRHKSRKTICVPRHDIHRNTAHEWHTEPHTPLWARLYYGIVEVGPNLLHTVHRWIDAVVAFHLATA